MPKKKTFAERVLVAVRRLDTQERAPNGQFGSGSGSGPAGKAAAAAAQGAKAEAASAKVAEVVNEARRVKEEYFAGDLTDKDAARRHINAQDKVEAAHAAARQEHQKHATMLKAAGDEAGAKAAQKRAHWHRRSH